MHGEPDTTYPNPCAGFFLGADPYLVNAPHESTALRAVYAGLTDLPCVGGLVTTITRTWAFASAWYPSRAPSL